jgi:hypothetical protein
MTKPKRSERYVCPVCGYGELDEAPFDEHGCASFAICPCCGTEFGYDDNVHAHAALRKKWIDSGMRWWSTANHPPANWDPKTQLMRIAG